ncbi:hypothetical protein LMG18090_01223 [Ralstonia mannitolilytica]|uniref:hypothetical protein n=1 Tax=Ralstonia mannitolilytica TaxID=105219 RepID=UPI0028F54DAA|nr:hypothetical protein [Ralstonia mannitolilytica]CAJ0780686.1 hypothetical protein LMG18090_01223 [Ralstonia mannitolilytica]
MERLSRLYVSHFGSPTAWYENLLFDLTDPDSQQPTDVIFNLENAGGKTSLLSYVFSCFEPKQERWLQHLQKKNHRFAEYFARDGRPSFIVMEWEMPARAAAMSDYQLIVGQAVALKESAERGADVERWFFAFEAIDGMGLEAIPAPGLSMAPVRTMQEFVQWMHQAGKRAGDFFHTKIQDDWIKHLGNIRLLDIELLRMQVDFNSSEGGMEDGFLTFNTESDLLRRFLVLTLDPEKSATVRDAVAQTADKLKSKPKYERRLEQLTRLQSVMVPFSEAATLYEVADVAQKDTQRQAAGLAVALFLRHGELHQSAQEKRAYAEVQDGIAKTSTDTATLLQVDVVAMQGLQHDRRVAAATHTRDAAKKAYDDGKHLLRCMEGAKALVHVEATAARVSELDALLESEREGLKPARQQAEIQGALLSCALSAAEKIALGRTEKAKASETNAGSLIEAINAQTTAAERVIRELSAEKGQLDEFQAAYGRQRDRLLQDHLLEPDDADSGTAIGRFEQQIEEQEAFLHSLNEQRAIQDELERSLRKEAGNAAIEASSAKTAQEPHRKFLADGEALRDELKQLAVLRTAADADEADPDSPILSEALDRLLADAHREIADRNIRLAQLKADRGSIVETGLAGRSADVDVVVRQLQGSGIRSARAANTYVAEVRPDVEDARALVLSDPARFLGVNVAQGEWAKAQQLMPTLKLKLSAPVTVAVASVDAAARSAERLVLAPQDDSAYNKESAQQALTALDARIAGVEEQLTAYEERRDIGAAASEKLRRYQTEFGAARLRQAEAEIDRLGNEERAAANRQQEFTAQADQAQSLGKEIATKAAPLPAKIEKLKGGLKRIQDYQRDWESLLGAKLARLAELQGLLDAKQAQIDEFDRQRSEADEQRSHAMEDRLRHEREARDLAAERAQIAHRDIAYPAEEQLRTHPRGIETLRETYADAVTTLQTQERDRLGVLAVKLESARQENTKAVAAYESEFADLDNAELEPLRTLDFGSALRDQKTTVDRLDEASRAAGQALAVMEAERITFWRGQKQKSAATREMQAKSDEELAFAIEDARSSVDRHEAMAERASQDATKARGEATQAESESKRVDTLHRALTAAVPQDVSNVQPMIIHGDASDLVNELILKFREQDTLLDELRGKAREAFRVLTKAANSKELMDAEPELARDIADSEFEPACSDRARIFALIEDRICATRDTLEGMKPDFENCVGELYNLTYEGIGLLNRACAQTMPITTPYVGGKQILKMKVSFTGVSVDARKDAIRQYLNAVIDSNVIPVKGADLVSQCLVAVSGRQELGLQVLKMEQNEAHQYHLASDLKSSGGQGTVIAMFLYLLISQLRADTRARAKRGGGGPLILDNPFAKVQTRALVDAQRLLAREIGVQLIFFTANADYNVLAGFRRVIRLRKSGANSKTGRSHIEMVSAAFDDLAERGMVAA